MDQQASKPRARTVNDDFAAHGAGQRVPLVRLREIREKLQVRVEGKHTQRARLMLPRLLALLPQTWLGFIVLCVSLEVLSALPLPLLLPLSFRARVRVVSIRLLLLRLPSCGSRSPP